MEEIYSIYRFLEEEQLLLESSTFKRSLFSSSPLYIFVVISSDSSLVEFYAKKAKIYLQSNWLRQVEYVILIEFGMRSCCINNIIYLIRLLIDT